MTLREEIEAERAAIRTDAQHFVERLISESRTQVERFGSCECVVVALDGSVPEFFHLSWINHLQKEKEFKEVERALAGRPVSATVYVIPSQVSLSNGSTERAVVVVAHTQDWKELVAVPFRIGEDLTVRWAQPIVQHEFNSNLFKTPYAGAN